MQGIRLIIYYLIATVKVLHSFNFTCKENKQKNKTVQLSSRSILELHLDSWTRIQHIQENKNDMQLACQKTNSIMHFTKITDK